jgi:hypothetical protein
LAAGLVADFRVAAVGTTGAAWKIGVGITAADFVFLLSDLLVSALLSLTSFVAAFFTARLRVFFGSSAITKSFIPAC